MMGGIGYKKRKTYYLLFIIPAFTFYTFALVGPLLFGTIPSAFFSWNIMKGTRFFIGVDNFINLLKDKYFLRSIRFTFLMSIITVFVTNVFGFLIACAVNGKIRLKGIIRACFFIPNIISGVMVAMLWTFIFQRVTPALGVFFHIQSISDFSWFSRPSSAFVAIAIVSIWQGTGFLMILYLTGLQTLSPDLMEAAELDGCSALQKTLFVQLPLLMPTITINLFISIANGFKSFDIIYALTMGGPAKTTQSMAINLYEDAFSKFNMGYACSKSVVLFFIILLITGIQIRTTRSREVQI